VTSTPAEPLAAQTSVRLRYVVGFFAAGLGLSALYAQTGVGLPCPFRALTGWDCPLCGGTRMGSALLHGDVATAWAFNPVALVGLVVLAVVGGAWAMQLAGGPRLRLPAPVRHRLTVVRPNQWLVFGVVAATAYTLLRNLL
jgi:hypothetical protein